MWSVLENVPCALDRNMFCCFKTGHTSFKIRNKTTMSSLSNSTQHSFGSLSHGSQTNESNPNWESSGKTVTVRRLDYTQKILKILPENYWWLVKEFSKVAGYKINTEKSLAFLYNNNEKSGREIKKSIPFTIATKKLNT